MKLLKVFQGRKSPSSPAFSSAISSRTSSSSSSHTSSSPPSTQLAFTAEIQSCTVDHQQFLDDSPQKESFKTAGQSDAHHLEQMPQIVGSPTVDLEHQELADAFKVLDMNGDGRISAGELGAVLRSLGDDPSEEDLQLMVEAVDADGDGYIDFEEFICLHRVAREVAGLETRAEELRAAFHVFDIDKNNYISAEELHQVLKRLGQQSLTMEECCRMISGVDSDGDGLVDFEEFERMMNSNSVS